MTTYKIPYISKKKNPNAGRTQLKTPGMTHTTLTYGKIDRKIFLVETYQGAKIKLLESGEWEVENWGYLENTKTSNYPPQGFKEGIMDFQIERDVITYHTVIPDPKYLYKYDMTVEVMCCECGGKFPAKQLVHDLDEDSGGNWRGSDTTCPVCGEGHCCELEFQK